MRNYMDWICYEDHQEGKIQQYFEEIPPGKRTLGCNFTIKWKRIITFRKFVTVML